MGWLHPCYCTEKSLLGFAPLSMSLVELIIIVTQLANHKSCSKIEPQMEQVRRGGGKHLFCEVCTIKTGSLWPNKPCSLLEVNHHTYLFLFFNLKMATILSLWCCTINTKRLIDTKDEPQGGWIDLTPNQNVARVHLQITTKKNPASEPVQWQTPLICSRHEAFRKLIPWFFDNLLCADTDI